MAANAKQPPRKEPAGRRVRGILGGDPRSPRRAGGGCRRGARRGGRNRDLRLQRTGPRRRRRGDFLRAQRGRVAELRDRHVRPPADPGVQRGRKIRAHVAGAGRHGLSRIPRPCPAHLDRQARPHDHNRTRIPLPRALDEHSRPVRDGPRRCAARAPGRISRVILRFHLHAQGSRHRAVAAIQPRVLHLLVALDAADRCGRRWPQRPRGYLSGSAQPLPAVELRRGGRRQRRPGQGGLPAAVRRAGVRACISDRRQRPPHRDRGRPEQQPARVGVGAAAGEPGRGQLQSRLRGGRDPVGGRLERSGGIGYPGTHREADPGRARVRPCPRGRPQFL